MVQQPRNYPIVRRGRAAVLYPSAHRGAKADVGSVGDGNTLLVRTTFD